MLQLLNDLLARKRGRAGNPASIYMRELVRNNMSRVSKRYKDSSKFVRPEHLVVKIINALGIGRTMSPEDAVYAAEDRMYSIANALGLTAATSFGKPQAHVTLDLGVESVLLYSEDFVRKDWRTLEPVTFLYHNQTNLNYQVGGERDPNAFAMVAINIGMLAYQFVQWSIHNRATGDAENVYIYIAKHVIFNSIYTYMDISMFNRYLFAITGTPVPEDKPYREISVAELEPATNKVIDKTISMLTSAQFTVSDGLMNTPLLFKESALDLTTMPETAYTAQCRWFLNVAVLPYIRYGVMAAVARGDAIDSGKLSTLKRELVAMENTQIFSRLSPQLSSHIMSDIYTPLMQML